MPEPSSDSEAERVRGEGPFSEVCEVIVRLRAGEMFRLCAGHWHNVVP